MGQVLSIIETAYRGTIEEQDDTIVWLSHLLKRSGADIDVLLRGNAVNYAVKTQDASGLSFGAKTQDHPSLLHNDLTKIAGEGVAVHIVSEDLADRGIDGGTLIDGIEKIGRADVAGLCDRYDHVFHW